MIFRNKQFFTLISLIFMILGTLKSQDYVIDLRKANQLLSVAQERDRISSEELEDVKSRRLRMEEDLLAVQENPKLMSKEDKKKLENDIKTLRKNEEVFLYKRKLANNLMLDVTDILKASPKKRAKFIAEYEKRVAPIVLNDNTDEIKAMAQTPPSVSETKNVKDPIAELEKQSAAPPKQGAESSTIAPKSKPKKESSKKPKVEKNKEVVAETTTKKVEPKPKKESSKKPKVEKPKEPVAETAPKKSEAQPKKETTKKPKAEKQTVATTKTTSKQKKESQKKPKNETPPVVVSESTEPTTEPTTEVVVKQPDTAAGKFGDFLTTMTEAVPENPEPPKKKTQKQSKVAKQPKIAQNANVRVPSESQVATHSESKKKKKEEKPVVAKTRTESSKSNVVYKKYDAKEDPMLITPSNLDCNLAFDGKDNFTGKKKQETTPIILFAHTDDFMRAAMKNKDFVTCEATATRVEGSRIVYLNLIITVQSKDAQRTFGFLDRGALIIFRFINGKKLSLATNKTDIGIVDVDKGTTTFRAQLAIAETVEYTASELDAIRVSWSIGYEDYEIYDMDILRNLFKCLDKK